MNEIMIDTPNGRFAVLSAGTDDAPVALMLHGFPDDASTFDGLGEALASQGYRAIAPYLRGYAPSPLNGPLTLEAMIGDPIVVPTLFIAGAGDGCLLPRLSDGQEAIFTGGYERLIWPGVGHFPHLEEPNRALNVIAEWFAGRRR